MKKTILGQAILNESHLARGRTAHVVAGERTARPAVLQLVQFEGDSGCYLFGLAEDGRELTDTYHDNIQLARDQARFEFEVSESDWVNVGGSIYVIGAATFHSTHCEGIERWQY